MEETYYRPSGRGPQLIAVYIFFQALTTITVALRVYVRAFMVKNFGADDWIMILGWAIFLVFTSSAITGAFHGTGQHAELIQPAWNLPIGLKWWWLCEPLYIASNMAVKLSIGVMLLRLVVERSHKMAIYITVGVAELYSLAFFFIFLVQCTPPKFFWTRYQGDTDGTCFKTSIVVNVFYGYSAIVCVVDWTLALLPWFLVRSLQMNSRTKLMVAFVLGMGSIASAATIIRLPYIGSMNNEADFLYATTDVAIWSCTETGLSIVASSAATLKPLFVNFMARNKFFGGTSEPSKAIPLGASGWSDARKKRSQYVRSHSVDGSEEELQKHKSEITKTTQVDVRQMSWAK